MSLKIYVIALIVSALSLVCCQPAWAAFHLWRIQEIYSNADGTVQFVELVSPTPSSGEQAVSGQRVMTSTAPARTFTLPSSLPCSPLPCNSSGKTFLVATPLFASQPGAVTPDYTVPASMVPFFSRVGDTVRFSGSSDTFIFGAGQLPTTNFLSRVDTSPFTPATPNFVNVLNSPRNWAGQVGSLFLAGDLDSDSDVDRSDVVLFASNLGRASGATRAQGDFTGDGRVAANDLWMLQNNLSPVASPSAIVPEPSTWILAITGTAAFAGWRRLRTRNLT